ncbi:DUF624 domain-containing protein (plasmid) [Haloterrigena salifodinae]|uniref:DUF624 domain-containing protein n=1 Tax=Haloterrigena salifodinae TaxID=2675099 RepID=A0A8T8E694_9EURY|nr:DUF624 domain-containing protein [Haloterrigena salifodinae]QRV17404.1 DUF624 domain-containing protein [Haloterrigena salifodinae]
MNSQSDDDLELADSIATFVRVAYDELATVVVTSVLFVLTSLPIITVGAAIIALVETLTAVVAGDSPRREVDRARQFVRSYRCNLRAGIPFSGVLIGVVASTYLYLILAIGQGSEFILGGLVGLYAIVVVVTLLFRAASILARLPENERPNAVEALREAVRVSLFRLSYTILHLATVGVLLVAGGSVWISLVILVPGLLAILEVIAFEDMAGDGAGAVRD